MIKVDRRIQRTLDRLTNTFIDMALEIGYDNITVRNLSRRAGIGHSTFYRHFPDKEELLMTVLRGTIQGIKDAVAPAGSPREEAVLKYRYAYQHPQAIRLYLSLPPENPARQMVWDELAELVRQRYRPQESSNVEPDIAVNHILASTHELVTWCLDNIDRYSPDEVATIYGNLIVRATADLALEPREDWLQRFA